MNNLRKDSVTYIEVDGHSHAQRIDNFLFKTLKGVPKSHVYRILRSGEVRVNSKRVDASYKVASGDSLRIPPIQVAGPKSALSEQRTLPKFSPEILFEDNNVLAINKPAGLAVHGGSGVNFGVIEQLRARSAKNAFLELVHRIDRDTSGVLLLAKKRAALTALHAAMRENHIIKRYLTLVKGEWKNAKQNVKFSLHKYVTAEGERRVSVMQEGQAAHTIFTLERASPHYSLLQAELKTGRTHQIRVHLAHLGFPIAGDDKYGDFAWNKQLQKLGLKRMFLHAQRLMVAHPVTGETLDLRAPLPPELRQFLQLISLDSQHAESI